MRGPGAGRLAVNFEGDGELALSGGDARNEAVYEVTDEKRGMRDLAIESRCDGTRAGDWRIAEVLDRFGAKATFSAHVGSARARGASAIQARQARQRVCDVHSAGQIGRREQH